MISPDAYSSWWSGGRVEEHPDVRIVHRDSSGTEDSPCADS